MGVQGARLKCQRSLRVQMGEGCCKRFKGFLFCVLRISSEESRECDLFQSNCSCWNLRCEWCVKGRVSRGVPIGFIGLVFNEHERQQFFAQNTLWRDQECLEGQRPLLQNLQSPRLRLKSQCPTENSQSQIVV